MAVKTNLKSSFAKVNEALAGAFDDLGIRRAFTVPYTEGHSASDHIKAVGAVLSQHGGATTNLLSSHHHEGKKGWGSGEGETVAHPVNKLQSTVIPKDSEAAKKVIQAVQTHLNGFKELLGADDPDVQAAQNQLNLVKRTEAAGMTAFDLGVMVQNFMFKLTQKTVRTHSLANANTPASEMESGLGHTEPSEEGLEEAQGGQETAQGDASDASQGSATAPTVQAAPAAPNTAQSAPVGATQQA